MKALFPGSFDPFTIGHFNIVTRAACLFSDLYIVIGENSQKQQERTIQEKEEIINSYPLPPNVSVIRGDNRLIGEVCKDLGVGVIVKGVRGVVDFEYEKNQADINSDLFPDLQTIFLPAEYNSVSSSLVRELIRYKHDGWKSMVWGSSIELIEKYYEVDKNSK